MSQNFTFTTIEVPGALVTGVDGFNNSGTLVGYFNASKFSVYEGFIESNGTYTTLNDPNGVKGTQINGINATGTIAGTFFDSSNSGHGFIESQGTFVTLNDPNAVANNYQGTNIEAINNGGTVAGWYSEANGETDGFIESNGTFTTIDDPFGGGGETEINAINNGGTIAGVFSDENGPHGFIDINGTFTTVDDPNAVNGTYINDINDSGQVVGYYVDGNDAAHGFIYSGGSFTTVDEPDAVRLTELDCISDSGQIVGFSYGNPADFSFVTEIPCLASGTSILTPDGPRLVEMLRIGDEVVTAQDGIAQVIIWIGKRSIDLRHHAKPDKVVPVIICAGAFSDGLPERNLRLSPDHCVFIDGCLIEAKTLVNGVTVIRETGARYITYHHIELASHDIMLAEGLPIESYLESGNRMMFEGDEAPVILHPDFTAVSRLKACAPLVTDGPAVLAARRKLLERAVALGFVVTDAVDLTARVAGREITPELAGDEFLFMLPSNTARVELISSVGVPAEISADPGDRRVLGVAVTGLALIINGKRIMISIENPAHDGFYAMENGHRWTNGAARIALPEHTGRAMLEVTINGQASRWVQAA